MQGPWDYGSSMCSDWGNEYISIQMVASTGVTELLERFGMERRDSPHQGTQIKGLRIVCNLETYSVLMSTADGSKDVNGIIDIMSLVDLNIQFSLNFQYMNSTYMN